MSFGSKNIIVEKIILAGQKPSYIFTTVSKNNLYFPRKNKWYIVHQHRGEQASLYKCTYI